MNVMVYNITNFSRLVSGQLSNHNGATNCCKKCLHDCSTPELLEAHAMDYCHVQRIKFPKDPVCRFTNIQNQLPAPFVVYAGFESILTPVNEDVDVTQDVETGIESSSLIFQKHNPCSFAYKKVSSVDTNSSRPLVMYRGEDAAEMFVRKLQLEAKQLFDEYIATPKPMLLTATESQSFTTTAICHICRKPLEDDEVRDHCHITGNYRSVAHNECNLNYRIKPDSWELPVVIHNLKGYREFGKVLVIQQNMETYPSLTVGQLKFIDYFR